MATSVARLGSTASTPAPLARSHVPEVARRAGGAFALVVAFLLWMTAQLAAPANAEAPMRVDEQISDSAGVLGADTDRVRSALDELQTDRGISLWLTYVNTFDGLGAEQWTEQTYRQSGLGTTDALLAVGVEEGEYRLKYDGPSYSEAEIQDVATESIVPALREDDWAGAAVGAADGLRGESSSGSGASSSGIALFGFIIVLIVVLLVAIPWWLSRRRKKREAQRAEQAMTIDPADSRSLAQLDNSTLDARSRAALASADQSLRSSRAALEAARNEFGDIRAREFQSAIDRAEALVGNGHQLVTELDDTIPETPAQQKQMLLQLAEVSARAEESLDEQRERFDEMRRMLVNGDTTVDTLRRRTVTARSRLDLARSTLAVLGQRYPAEKLASIEDNPELAQALIESAESELDQARTALQDPTGNQGAAVDQIMHAAEAVEKAETFLDAVENASTDIASATAELPALIEEVREELVEARTQVDDAALDPRLAADLRKAMALAQGKLDTASGSGADDPLGSYRELAEADVALDRAMADAGREIADNDRIRRAVEASLSSARSAVREAQQFIHAREAVVGQSARSKLSSAERALKDAEQAEGYVAADAATAASTLGRQALTSAQQDVQNRDSFSSLGGGYGGGFGGGMGSGDFGGYRHRGYGRNRSVGNELAGALVRGVLFGVGSSFGSGGGRNRGFGGGGFGRGGFGGGIGGGGRGGFGGGGGGGSVGGRF